MKKFISIFLTVVLLINMSVLLSFSAEAKKKVFKANKKKITLTEKKKKKITITNSIGTKVSCKIANKKICSCKWGKWKKNKIKLTIRGKKNGKTKITIKSDKTKKKIKIVIKVNKVKKVIKKTNIPATNRNPIDGRKVLKDWVMQNVVRNDNNGILANKDYGTYFFAVTYYPETESFNLYLNNKVNPNNGKLSSLDFDLPKETPEYLEVTFNNHGMYDGEWSFFHALVNSKTGKIEKITGADTTYTVPYSTISEAYTNDVALMSICLKKIGLSFEDLGLFIGL